MILSSARVTPIKIATSNYLIVDLIYSNIFLEKQILNWITQPTVEAFSIDCKDFLDASIVIFQNDKKQQVGIGVLMANSLVQTHIDVRKSAIPWITLNYNGQKMFFSSLKLNGAIITLKVSNFKQKLFHKIRRLE